MLPLHHRSRESPMKNLIRKHLLDIVIILMFIVGLSVLLYPSVSSYINAKHASRAIMRYSEAMDNASDEVIAGMLRVAESYNKALSGDRSAFFLPELVGGYESTLDITGTGIMGYIDIGKIGVQLPIYHGVDPTVLQVGVGHLEGTSLPVGGKNTHCVLSGHRGLPSARLFTDLDKLEVGDTFSITVLRQTLLYQVDQIKIVLPSESQDLQIVNDKDYCTLLTCTPYGINTHRLLVRGVRIHQSSDDPRIFVPNEAFRIDPLIVMPVVAAPMFAVCMLILLTHSRKWRYARRRKKEEKKKA